MGKTVLLRDAAVSMEERMAAFYRSWARRGQNERVRHVLEFLAEEEDQHARELVRLTEERTDTECLDQAFEEAGDIMWWLRDSGEALTEKMRIATTEEGALTLALQAEKDSIVFYHTLLKHVKRADLGREIEKLLEFEYAHVEKLAGLLRIVKRSHR